jgi:hypothetical protein
MFNPEAVPRPLPLTLMLIWRPHWRMEEKRDVIPNRAEGPVRNPLFPTLSSLPSHPTQQPDPPMSDFPRE